MPQLRKPTITDVPTMHALMRPHILREALLPRTARSIVERLRDYTVAEEQGEIIGLVSLSLVEMHLAEIGALICDAPDNHQRLLEAALLEARSFGVKRVFVLAPHTEAALYEDLGFSRADISDFPEKRDRQCLRCSRLPRCRQVVFARTL